MRSGENCHQRISLHPLVRFEFWEETGGDKEHAQSLAPVHSLLCVPSGSYGVPQEVDINKYCECKNFCILLRLSSLGVRWDNCFVGSCFIKYILVVYCCYIRCDYWKCRISLKYNLVLYLIKFFFQVDLLLSTSSYDKNSQRYTPESPKRVYSIYLVY